jgi:mono/diheme cytochrome c family protein
MISPRMSPAVKLFLASVVSLAVAIGASGCGTQRISVPKSPAAVYHGAVLFNQRCSGCHTLSYAATHGSASSVRTAQYNNGPNFDQRCERPMYRVLYAIENGGFSGAIMPQNIVVGQDAIDVAKFVATYAGRQAPRVPGVVVCQRRPIGTIPAFTSGSSATGATGATGASGPTGPAKAAHGKARAKAKAKHKP